VKGQNLEGSLPAAMWGKSEGAPWPQGTMST
jgi:hypothetical protein